MERNGSVFHGPYFELPWRTWRLGGSNSCHHEVNEFGFYLDSGIRRTPVDCEISGRVHPCKAKDEVAISEYGLPSAWSLEAERQPVGTLSGQAHDIAGDAELLHQKE